MLVVGTGSGSGGGGSSDELCYVTFMSHDGTEEYGKKAVAVGDDCANPIERGIFDTPSIGPTDQYIRIFDGWSTTMNGETDEDALKAVWEDRTVYATYVNNVRSYFIRFYDGDTLIHSESYNYGEMPSYTPTKDGYDFVAWEPELTTVTGEASYTATWKAKAAFGTATWAEISAITTAGESAGTFSVDDKRDEVLTYANGTTENIEVVIAHIRDDGKLVLALNHALATKKQMNSSVSGGGSTYLDQPLYSYLTGTVYPALSEEFRAVIQTISNGLGKNCSIFLPTETNCGTANSTDVYKCIGDWKLDLFATAANRIRKLGKNGTTSTNYWLGTSNKTSGSYHYYKYVDTTGAIKTPTGAAAGITATYGVVFLVVV